MSLPTLSTSSPAPASTRVQGRVLFTGVSSSITPPCIARRVLPCFPAPGCHMYDAYNNCFLYRPDVRQMLSATAQQEQDLRQRAALRTGDAAAVSAGVNAAGSGSEAGMQDWTSCCCALDATQLFATPRDIPNPPLPLSRCELHEVHLALSPRWQGYPWRLCFDTATDGFSLASFYRHMEDVEARQSQVKTVAFGLFFVDARDDTLLCSEPNGIQGDSASVSSGIDSSVASPLSSRGLHAFHMVHHASLQRYGGARSTLPHSVIGCFTPEVPCLIRHAANIYFGSPDTFVFRLSQLNCALSRGVWMAADVEGRRQQGEEMAAAGIASVSGSAAEGHTRSHGTAGTIAASLSGHGYKSLGIRDEGDVGAPVPMPTHMTKENPFYANPTVNAVVVNSSLELTAPLTSNHAPLRSVCSVPGRSPLLSPTSRRRRPLFVVPQEPLLQKYVWCGRAQNKRFVVCNSHFFAIGGGTNGPALYVDETLQYGTSSRWCETFNAPSLFEPHTLKTATRPASPLRKSPIFGESPFQDSLAPTRVDAPALVGGLPHTEFAISRVVWFSITEDKRELRTMNADSDPLPSAVTHRCGCGRWGRACDSYAAPHDSMASTQPPSSTVMHRCNLIPFAAPM
ncbi:hypothetical protein JKF63_07162 [Porcisia hertigi]|uniref:Oxidation resistance protein 1 n=1 Tax=Porcisia hertigi TaxID=2761500 RepID=A0A836LKF9_9TRYP|nr:hypothetical protein JKF63_07162 [Porcisia hertigi]